MKTVTVRKIQELDKVAIHQYGIPSIALMENAGKSVALEVLKHLKKTSSSVCVVCGLGNNAGDGFVAARHLMNHGVSTKTFLIGKGRQLKEDAALNYKILKRLHYPIKEFKRLNSSVAKDIAKSDVVIDAIFGVGLNRDVGEPFKTVITTMNEKAKCIVSVDSPSGLDGTTGQIYGVCVKAKKTVTFSFMKKGFLKRRGPSYTGKVVVVDIGIPGKLKKRFV